MIPLLAARACQPSWPHSTRIQIRGNIPRRIKGDLMMSKFLLGGAIAAIVAGSAALAQAAPQPGQPAARGHSSQTEARTDVQAHVGQMFARLDSNRAVFITKAQD